MKSTNPFIAALLLLFLSMNCLWSQIQFAPLTHNPQLSEQTPSEFEASSAYADIVQLNVQTLKTDSICINLFLINEPFERLDYEPAGIIGGDVEINENCVIFSAGFIQFPVVDSIDLFLVDTSGQETPVLLIVKTRPALDLPFIDNFSSPGPYPKDDLWLDRHVFINRSLAFQPLSLGVATLDGTDEFGVPYGGGAGISDYLTSSFIDLSAYDFPVLQFYYQARGRGFGGFPRETDSLILEFRTEDGSWQRVISYPGIENGSVSPFQYEEVLIAEDFRYDGFQFRFKNISRRDGVLGLWHLDYVQLRDEPVPTSNIADISLLREPSGALAPYRALPAKQFKNWISSQTASDIRIALSNNFPSTQEVSLSRLLVQASPGNIPLIEETLLEVPPVVSENQRTLSPGQFNFTNPIKRRDGLINAMQTLSFTEDDSTRIVMIYEIEPENEDNQAVFEQNNRVSVENKIMDYYAYDDGSAEVGIYVQGTGQFDMVAQEYEAIEGDTLRAIRINFPFVFSEGERQRFELMIWRDSLSATPAYSKFYDQPIFGAAYGEGPASFTNFSLKTPTDQDTTIFIPKGKFYVGWRQVSASSPFGLYVGFDRDSPDATSKIYFNSTGSWTPISGGTIEGAIMIRPVFGTKLQITTKSETFQTGIKEFLAYPNPASNFLFLDAKETVNFDPLEIIAVNMLGQYISLPVDGKKISIGHLSRGLYTLLLFDAHGTIVGQSRFVKN